MRGSWIALDYFVHRDLGHSAEEAENIVAAAWRVSVEVVRRYRAMQGSKPRRTDHPEHWGDSARAELDAAKANPPFPGLTADDVIDAYAELLRAMRAEYAKRRGR